MLILCLVVLFLFGWFHPWVWWFSAIYSSWVNLILFVLELSGVLSSGWCMYALSIFFLEALRAMSFPLRTVFIVSHKFGYVVPSFSLNSRKPLIYFFFSYLTKLSLNRVLFIFHVYVGFLLFMLLLKISLSLQWSDRMTGIISIFLYLLRPVLWPVMWSVWRRHHEVMRKSICFNFRIKYFIDIS